MRSLGALYAQRRRPAGPPRGPAGRGVAGPPPPGSGGARLWSGVGWRAAGFALALLVGAAVLWLPPGGLEPRAVRFPVVGAVKVTS